jgi:hypothetical protein
MPSHESAQQVDGIGGRDLVGERVGEARLPVAAQFSGLIDDKTTRFDSSLQCHVTTGASAETEDKRGTH